MTVRPDPLRPLFLAAALALVPARGMALPLLQGELSLGRGANPGLRVALADAPPPGPMDFDLLGDAPKAQVPPEDGSQRTRRRMLSWHQGVGIGLMGLQLATTVVGQLNYNDKFGVDNTGKYTETHAILAYSNVAAFAVTGALALFAPRAKGPKPQGAGRVTIHRIGMAVATAGMVAQVLLGIQTARREGYLDKEDYGRAHLVVGYTTLAAMSVAVGALVF